MPQVPSSFQLSCASNSGGGFFDSTNSCPDGTTCQSGCCVPNGGTPNCNNGSGCGAAGQACCNPGPCGNNCCTDSSVNCNNGYCVCGNPGQPTCKGGGCGEAGQPCCNGTGCSNPSLICNNGNCIYNGSCGGSGQTCCYVNGNDVCNSGLTCTHPAFTCEGAGTDGGAAAPPDAGGCQPLFAGCGICCSGLCSGTCFCRGTGGSCTGNNNCCSSQCVNSACTCAIAGQPCFYSNDCCSGNCQPGTGVGTVCK
jgi:hypothetical protein